MASPARDYSNLVMLVTLSLIFFSPSKTVGVVVLQGGGGDVVKQNKQMLGSRPPMCVNKCFSCRPCRATLVIPPHNKKTATRVVALKQDDTYYLLTWKCRCGNRIYQP